ncbi:MAG: hypothetical protein AAFY20_08420 [Cyanobacteria bacterium J06639_14]
MNSSAPQNTTPQSPTTNPVTAPIEGLQPSLGNALSSLNMQLDRELARYRHAKRGSTQPTATPQFRSRQRSPKLINVPTQSSHSQGAARPPVTPPPPPPNPRLQNPSQPPNVHESKREGGAIATPEPPEKMATPAAPVSEVAALRSALVRQSAPVAADPDASPEEEYLASSEALLESFDNSYVGQAPETITQRPEPNWTKHLNTPLGLGALMLLLVTSAGFGFILVNPVAVRHLVDHTPLARIWPHPEDELAADATSTATDDVDSTNVLGEAPLNPLSPDLSRQEFAELDFDSLSSLPSAAAQARIHAATPTSGSPSAAPKAKPEMTVPNASGNTNATLPPTTNPSANRPLNPAVPTVTSIPQPTTAPATGAAVSAASPAPPANPAPAVPPPVAAQPAPPTIEPVAAVSEPVSTPVIQPESPAVIVNNGENTPGNFYYVVTDYTGDPSLDSARTAVDEAYVRNFEVGARIQMGAFESEEAAAIHVEELQNQGIEAEVYTPDSSSEAPDDESE